MPIYDNNGTEVKEIGKLYDDYTTEFKQIGEVWDNDGTSNTLIYKAEQTVFPGGTPTTKTFQASSLTTVGSFYANTSNSNGEAGMAYLGVDVSDWDKLSVTWSASSGQYSMVYVGLKSSVATSGGTWYLPNDTNSFYTLINGTSKSQTSTTTNINVSSITGTYYLLCHVYSGSTRDAVSKSAITSAILS